MAFAGKNRVLSQRMAVVLIAMIGTASASAHSTVTPYKPKLVLFLGQSVPSGESRFSILTDARGPATADVDLYVPAAFAPTLTQPVGTALGQISATVLDHGLTQPYAGTLAVTDTSAADPGCDSAAHSAVWQATLANGSSSFSFTLYVRHSANPAAPHVPQPTEIHWCFPATVPKLSNLAFDLHGVFAQPRHGESLWDARLTPYDPTGTVADGAEQVSSLVLARFPERVELTAHYSTATRRYIVTGRVTEDAKPIQAPITVWRTIGTGPLDTRHATLTHTNTAGRFALSQRLITRRTVRFTAHAIAPGRNLSKPSCGHDINGVPCVSKTLAVWEQDSNTVSVPPPRR